MACCNANNNTTNNQPTTKGNYIREAVARIDQLQKEATMQNLCEGCDGGLMAQIYNTKPVTFYLCGGTTFTVTIPNTTTTTSVFRVEDVRNDAAVLRLIDTTAEEITCTNYTVIFNLDCACGLQCFQPICCERCTGACNNTTI